MIWLLQMDAPRAFVARSSYVTSSVYAASCLARCLLLIASQSHFHYRSPAR